MVTFKAVDRGAVEVHYLPSAASHSRPFKSTHSCELTDWHSDIKRLFVNGKIPAKPHTHTKNGLSDLFKRSLGLIPLSNIELTKQPGFGCFVIFHFIQTFFMSKYCRTTLFSSGVICLLSPHLFTTIRGRERGLQLSLNC